MSYLYNVSKSCSFAYYEDPLACAPYIVCESHLLSERRYSVIPYCINVPHGSQLPYRFAPGS